MKEQILEYLEITAKAAGFSGLETIPEIAGAVIGAFLSLLGVIFLFLIIYAGFFWMTAGGNDEKVLQAKKTLTNAIVGLIIVVAAYAITVFVFGVLQNTSV